MLLVKTICRSDLALPHLVLAEAELRQMASLLPSGTREVLISHHAQPSASMASGAVLVRSVQISIRRFAGQARRRGWDAMATKAGPRVRGSLP